MVLAAYYIALMCSEHHPLDCHRLFDWPLGLPNPKHFGARADVGLCAGFRTPAVTKPPHARAAGVRKAPRHEIAGRWGPVGAAGLYGDLAAWSGWARLDRTVRSNRLAAQDGCRWRTERAQRALPDRVGW